MSPRLAPALGLAAACAMLTGVGIIAISAGSDGAQPTEIAGALVTTPSAPAKVTPSLAARQQATRPSIRTSATAASSTPVTTPRAAEGPVSSIARVGTTPSSTGSSTNAGTSSSPVPPPAPSTGSTGLAGSPPPLRTTAGTNRDTYAQAVFDAVNQARAAHHLAPLMWSAALQTSAHRHNIAMAQSNTLSHQVDGEPSLGARETAAGVTWTFAAENIGWTTDRSQAGAVDIENRMYAETAPDDAHRRNILTTSATSLGIDVYIDAAHGRLWLTEDFAG